MVTDSNTASKHLSSSLLSLYLFIFVLYVGQLNLISSIYKLCKATLHQRQSGADRRKEAEEERAGEEGEEDE